MTKLEKLVSDYLEITYPPHQGHDPEKQKALKTLLFDFGKNISNAHHKAIEILEESDAYDNGVPMSDLFENEFINELC